MKLHASGEDYLEAVLVLQRKKGMVRSVDVARHMGQVIINQQDLFPHETASRPRLALYLGGPSGIAQPASENWLG